MLEEATAGRDEMRPDGRDGVEPIQVEEHSRRIAVAQSGTGPEKESEGELSVYSDLVC